MPLAKSLIVVADEHMQEKWGVKGGGLGECGGLGEKAGRIWGKRGVGGRGGVATAEPWSELQDK